MRFLDSVVSRLSGCLGSFNSVGTTLGLSTQMASGQMGLCDRMSGAVINASQVLFWSARSCTSSQLYVRNVEIMLIGRSLNMLQ